MTQPEKGTKNTRLEIESLQSEGFQEGGFSKYSDSKPQSHGLNTKFISAASLSSDEQSKSQETTFKVPTLSNESLSKCKYGFKTSPVHEDIKNYPKSTCAFPQHALFTHPNVGIVKSNIEISSQGECLDIPGPNSKGECLAIPGPSFSYEEGISATYSYLSLDSPQSPISSNDSRTPSPERRSIELRDFTFPPSNILPFSHPKKSWGPYKSEYPFGAYGPRMPKSENIKQRYSSCPPDHGLHGSSLSRNTQLRRALETSIHISEISETTGLSEQKESHPVLRRYCRYCKNFTLMMSPFLFMGGILMIALPGTIGVQSFSPSSITTMQVVGICMTVFAFVQVCISKM